MTCCSTNITIDDFYEIKGIVKEEELFDIVSALVNGNTKEALEKLDYLGKKGKNLILFATELIEYLKNMLISNNTYGLDKDKIFEMIDILNDTVNNMKNSCYQKVLLEVAFLKVENLLKNIEIVDNEEKAVKKEELQEKPKEKQKEDIIKLKQDKKDLNDLIDYWKNKFLEIIKLIKDKLFGKKEEREQYMDIANELYNKDIIDTKLFDEMYNIYEKIEKYDNNRGKFDDFEL